MEDDQSESVYSNGISASGQSRFTLNSRLSNASKSALSRLSRLQSKVLVQTKERVSTCLKVKSPFDRLQTLCDEIDMMNFLFVNWLISPIIDARAVKSRVFMFGLGQIRALID